ncbi:uncharacterized protein PRCAT00000595001 [Priceomyces carsonii]|uniref:uncharacterized protein n=1 Tax=Priceomyces carsonii TaxID=28549 RepID=UPI002ED861BA|nr:unnamed protein product [Priceomyces carsonii]
MSSPVLKQEGDNTENLLKTAIIVSNLSREDFVAKSSTLTTKTLSFVDSIKLTTLSLKTPEGVGYVGDEYYLNNIEYWSALPTLNRIIIIMRSEEGALNLYNHLKTDSNLDLAGKNIKVSLQENLLKSSKSYDSLADANSLSVTKTLANFKDFHTGKTNEYTEPEPQPFNAIEDLSKLGIDLLSYNNNEQLNELKDTSSVKRTRSLTKTLFKPDLKLTTSFSSSSRGSGSNTPSSPTITLDDGF